MTDRAMAIAAFLEDAGWTGATRRVLAGDASNRRYDRLTASDGTRAVLMDAPSETGETITPFVTIARHLRAQGLSAPAIMAEDAAQGFLLLEDLGDSVFAQVIERDPGTETALYERAVDLLVLLHELPSPKGLSHYDPQALGEAVEMTGEWYGGGSDLGARLGAEVRRLAEALAPETDVLVLRDYHAENLIWMPDRRGIAAVGLLDFQDALIGHPAYDLMSLLRDIRRTVSPDLVPHLMTRYATATGQDAADFSQAAALMGAQRNLRILGIFARLCLRDGKPGYLQMIPQVWRQLQIDLTQPALTDLADLARVLPEPDTAMLDEMRTRCGTQTA